MPAEKNGKKKEKKRKGKKKETQVFSLSFAFAKVCCWCFAGIFAILILALIFRDVLLKAALEKTVAYLLGVDVTIDEVDSSLFRGTIAFRRIRIANPPGFDSPVAFECNEIFIEPDIPTLFSDDKVYKKIYINGVTTTAEYDRKGVLNAAKLNEELQTHLTQDPPKEKKVSQHPLFSKIKIDDFDEVSDSPHDEAPSGSVLIRDFRFSAQAYLRADGVALILVIPLNPVIKKDLLIPASNRSFSRTMNDLTLELDTFCDSFLNARGFIWDAGQNLVKGAENTGGSWLQKTGEAGKNLLESAGKSGKSVWNSISNLFQ